MGQVHVQVILTNHREAVRAQFGQLDPNRVHRYETKALIDTGATRSAIPLAVADRLGLYRIRRTEAQYVYSRVEEVDVTEAVMVEIVGRETVIAWSMKRLTHTPCIPSLPLRGTGSV